MEIHSIGYHHPHDRNFIIDRPDGIGSSWLFLLFKTEAVIKQNGKETAVRPNSFIIYSGEEPEYYRACSEEYIDDWFHFTVEQMDIQLFSELNIPINKVTYIGDISEITSIIRAMTYEFHASNIYSADITELYLKMLFFKLSRVIHSSIRELSEHSASRYDEMIRLRSFIYSNISEIGTVSDMAAYLSMSKSSFQHTYKKIFGVSVMNDVIQSRLNHAKKMLSTTSYPLKTIAKQSGFSSEFHLMRQFREKTGMTPSEYRRKCM
ncbi:MAG: helix-turn-helix domain-containing protein [Porcipelethomonas sp.]